MIQLASVKTLLEIIKQVTDIVTGDKKSTEDEFDQKINTMFKEIESIASDYFALFSELRTIVTSSKDKPSLDLGIDLLLTKRDQIILNRNKVSGSLDAYRKIAKEKGFDKSFDKTEHSLKMFLSDVDTFFYVPFGLGTSQFTLLIDELSEIQESNEQFGCAQQKSLELIYLSCSLLERAWRRACENFEYLKTDKEGTMRVLSK